MTSPGEVGRGSSIDPTTSHWHPHDDRGVTRGGTQISCGYALVVKSAASMIGW